jgi:hypothetical protein
MASDRTRELTKQEVERLPETSLVPPAARVVFSDATGTWEGCGFDNLDKSASSDRYFEGPCRFSEVLRWYEEQLGLLGWPPGSAVNAANGTRWHHWELGIERIDLIDRVLQPDDAVANVVPPEWRGQRLQSELPAGWTAWSVSYKRRPPLAAEFDGEERRL